jgi:trehalose 6-phosphate synthase/phosphatase
MKRIYIASNRLLVSVERKRGTIEFAGSIGGLATGIEQFHDTHRQSRWIGWPGIAADKITLQERQFIARRMQRDYRSFPIFLSQEEIDAYYNGFCNGTLWPLFHYFTRYVRFDEKHWEAYRAVNERFCRELLKRVREDDEVWVHDFHLMLLPQMLRERRPRLSIGFFLHIPFPSFELFRLLPWKAEILRGLAGADLIGFHTYDYVLHFLRSMQGILGVEHEFGQMMVGERLVRADAFPLGVDVERCQAAAAQTAVRETAAELRKEIGARKVVISIDRLDYTKGITERLRAFRELLKRFPQYRGKITLVLVVPLSRTRVQHYRDMKQEIDQLVGSINGAYGMLDWTPIHYLTRTLSFEELTTLYVAADIALVTPIRDGMNLVAKEYLASRTENTGVLVLSEMAGAAKELSEAILVNPLFEEGMVRGLVEAIEMPEKEQKRRNALMRESLARRHAGAWAESFLGRLAEVKALQGTALGAQLGAETQRDIAAAYGRARRRLLFLDYDGTLHPFCERPERAKPSARLLHLLAKLAEQGDVVLATGRTKDNVERWFSSLPIGFIAEHGAWMRERDGQWRQLQPLNVVWKQHIREVLEQYVDSTPGSFIEEKEFSLAWHVRTVDPELREARLKDLLSVLVDLIRTLGLVVRKGNRVIEVKNEGVDKGKAAEQWLLRESWDFVFAAGDDWTDEDLFRVLPAEAFSVKIGAGGPSHAKARLRSHTDVLRLLRVFARRGERDADQEE